VKNVRLNFIDGATGMSMTTEQHLQKAQRLAQALADVDDNEVRKVYGFLAHQHQMSALHELVKALPTSPFKNRSGKTPDYYSQMQKVIPLHLPVTMEVNDAIQILGWACRLLKYEKFKGAQQQSKRTGQQGGRLRGKGPKGGKRR
jgi:hypothetical protein